MVLSILICTYNREHFLELCINSILNQTEKHSSRNKIEIIVIDNNSKDGTKKIVKTFQNKSETIIHYYLEKHQGLSFARNRGVNEANGEFIAFVDDDATINTEWLSALIDGIKNIDADIFGGPIFPNFEVKCPQWIDKNYFVREFKNGDGYLSPIKAREGFSGGNMCVKKTIFKKIGNFNTQLGMIGNKLGLGEESEFFYRIYQENGIGKLYNLKAMSITHFEGKFKVSKEYMKERITLSGMQFAKRTITEEKLIGYLIVFAKIFKQFIDSIRYYLLRKKFKQLKGKWVMQGLIKGVFN